LLASAVAVDWADVFFERSELNEAMGVSVRIEGICGHEHVRRWGRIFKKAVGGRWVGCRKGRGAWSVVCGAWSVVRGGGKQWVTSVGAGERDEPASR